MKTLKELRENRAKKVKEMRALVDGAVNADGGERDMSAEEVSAYDALNADVATLSTAITRLEGLEAHEAVQDTAKPSQVQGLQANGRVNAPGAPAATAFENVGEFLAAVRFRPNDQRLNFVENENSAESRMDDGPSGGFMIPTEFRQGLFSVTPAQALVRPRASVIEAGDQSPDASVTFGAVDQRGSDPDALYGGVKVQWIGEGDTKPDAGNAKLREITLTPHEVAGTTVVTDKMLRNWSASDAWLRQQLRDAVTASEDRAFLVGDGYKKPLGGLVSSARFLVNRLLANKISYLDIVAMTSRILMRGGEVTPIWIASQATIPQLATLQDPEGRYIWKANAVDGFAGTLMGYPLRISNRVANLGGIGDISLVDWSYYVIKDGSGPFVAASEHVLFQQNKTMIKIFWNVDGAPWLTAPIVEENGWTVSPFVVLGDPAA